MLYERCAAVDVGKVDVGKDVIAVAVRLPGDGPDGRETVKRTFRTFYGVARWLVSEGVTHVAMEATGIYSRGAPPGGARGAGDRPDAAEDPGPGDGAGGPLRRAPHALMCRLHLDHIDHLVAMIAKLDAQIEAMMGALSRRPGPADHHPRHRPAGRRRGHLRGPRRHPGVLPRRRAPGIMARDVPRQPRIRRKHRPGKRRKGNQHLQPVPVECAWAAARHDGYLKSLYHRHVMKWGGYRSQLAKKKAIIVVAHAHPGDHLACPVVTGKD